MSDDPSTVHPAPAGDPKAALARARAELEAAAGLTWRPWERDDLPGVLALFEACEAADAASERESLDHLREYWDARRSRPERDTLAAWDGQGRSVATAWAGCNDVVTQRRGVHLGGAVHPDARGRGLGRAILAWELASARAWDAATREPGFGPLTLRSGVSDRPEAEAARHLLARGGLAPARYFFEMTRPTTDLPAPTPTPGIEIRDWDPEFSAAAHRVVDDAFEDHWGSARRTDEMWTEMLTASSFRPQWSCVALDGDAVVGVLLGAAFEQDWAAQGHAEGYADELGVLRSHRGRGVASALLGHHMRACRDAGLPRVALGVDAQNPTGALGLYERLGYSRSSTLVTFERREAPRAEGVARGVAAGEAGRHG